MRGPWASLGANRGTLGGSRAWEMPRWVSEAGRSFLGQTGSRGGGQRCLAVRGAWTRRWAARDRGFGALSPPRRHRGPQIPLRDLGSWGLKISPAALFLPPFRGPPAPWATPALYPRVALLPPQSSGLWPAHGPLSFPPRRDFYLPMEWSGAGGTSLGSRGLSASPSPEGTPAELPPVRPPALGCVGGAEYGGSLKLPGKRTRAFCSPIPSQVPS